MTNREIDALVAKHVMGKPDCVWHYSTEIAEAWLVVGRLSGLYDSHTMPKLDCREGDCIEWHMYIHGKDDVDVEILATWWGDNKLLADVTGCSMPKAICVAALEAVGVEL